jgi:hypothetical protein
LACPILLWKEKRKSLHLIERKEAISLFLICICGHEKCEIQIYSRWLRGSRRGLEEEEKRRKEFDEEIKQAPFSCFPRDIDYVVFGQSNSPPVSEGFSKMYLIGSIYVPSMV